MSNDLETRVQDLEAMHEIMNLESDYAYADDTHDPELYASVFAEDGVIDLVHLLGGLLEESLSRGSAAMTTLIPSRCTAGITHISWSTETQPRGDSTGRHR